MNFSHPEIKFILMSVAGIFWLNKLRDKALSLNWPYLIFKGISIPYSRLKFVCPELIFSLRSFELGKLKESVEYWLLFSVEDCYLMSVILVHNFLSNQAPMKNSIIKIFATMHIFRCIYTYECNKNSFLSINCLTFGNDSQIERALKPVIVRKTWNL